MTQVAAQPRPFARRTTLCFNLTLQLPAFSSAEDVCLMFPCARQPINPWITGPILFIKCARTWQDWIFACLRQDLQDHCQWKAIRLSSTWKHALETHAIRGKHAIREAQAQVQAYSIFWNYFLKSDGEAAASAWPSAGPLYFFSLPFSHFSLHPLNPKP